MSNYTNDYGFGFFKTLLFLQLIVLPLAIWKLVEIIGWLLIHIKIAVVL